MDIRKPFFESKIMLGALAVFIGSIVQVFSGYLIPNAVLETVPDTVLPALQQRTFFAIISAALSLYTMISRSVLKSDQIKKVWYKSGILWAAVFTFIAQIAYFYTGVQIPEELTTGIVALIMELVNTGDVIAFIAGALEIGVAIWRIFSTHTELEFTNVKQLRPSLTLYDKRQVA